MCFAAKHKKSLGLLGCEHSDTILKSQAHYLSTVSDSICKHLKALYIV